MAEKSSSFTRRGIAKLPNDKPVIYKIESASGKNNYTGIAKRGRVQERLLEHLPGSKDAVPGTRVRIEQMSTIQAAERKEKAIIQRSQPKYNEKHK